MSIINSPLKMDSKTFFYDDTKSFVSDLLLLLLLLFLLHGYLGVAISKLLKEANLDSYSWITSAASNGFFHRLVALEPDYS